MELATVRCPYCGEEVEILLEEDLEGEMVWDCEVCCRPWTIRIHRDPSGIRVDVSTADDG